MSDLSVSRILCRLITTLVIELNSGRNDPPCGSARHLQSVRWPPPTDQQEFRFNKFGSVGKAAGFLVVASGFVLRSVIRGYEGDLSFSNLISQISVLGAVLYTVLLVGLATALVRAVRKPESRLTLSADEIVFHGRGRPKRIDITSILAVAVLERPSKIPSIRRRPPNRTVVALSTSGKNLEPVPGDGRWVLPELLGAPRYRRAGAGREPTPLGATERRVRQFDAAQAHRVRCSTDQGIEDRPSRHPSHDHSPPGHARRHRGKTARRTSQLDLRPTGSEANRISA